MAMTQKERFQNALLAVAEARWPDSKPNIDVTTENGRLIGRIKIPYRGTHASYWAELYQDLGEEMIVEMANLLLTVSVPSK